jgi:hypothetical protein
MLLDAVWMKAILAILILWLAINIPSAIIGFTRFHRWKDLALLVVVFAWIAVFVLDIIDPRIGANFINRLLSPIPGGTKVKALVLALFGLLVALVSYRIWVHEEVVIFIRRRRARQD